MDMIVWKVTARHNIKHRALGRHTVQIIWIKAVFAQHLATKDDLCSVNVFLNNSRNM